LSRPLCLQTRIASLFVICSPVARIVSRVLTARPGILRRLVSVFSGRTTQSQPSVMSRKTLLFAILEFRFCVPTFWVLLPRPRRRLLLLKLKLRTPSVRRRVLLVVPARREVTASSIRTPRSVSVFTTLTRLSRPLAMLWMTGRV
jgi:hypothetical protein